MSRKKNPVTLPDGIVTILYGKDEHSEYIVALFADKDLARDKMVYLVQKSQGRSYWLRDFGVIVE